MASKKGIVFTVGILGAITIASFLIWLIPQNTQIGFVVTDYQSHLDGVKNIHQVIIDNLEIEFKKLRDGAITPTQYIQTAEISSTQVNTQIIQIVESKPSENWQEGYIQYLEALKKSNSYIRETIVYANMLEDGKGPKDLENALKKIQELKEESLAFIRASDEVRP